MLNNLTSFFFQKMKKLCLNKMALLWLLLSVRFCDFTTLYRFIFTRVCVSVSVCVCMSLYIYIHTQHKRRSLGRNQTSPIVILYAVRVDCKPHHCHVLKRVFVGTIQRHACDWRNGEECQLRKYEVKWIYIYITLQNTKKILCTYILTVYSENDRTRHFQTQCEKFLRSFKSFTANPCVFV